ncbi:glyoxalase superfamily protein [Mucilaginibacter angelicae]|uniref:Glyoxalase superfamily protein n=1 Tax=Mucilaginibacter angelicae TaxID=869718 RepID=A0ABV6L255_9SPHI
MKMIPLFKCRNLRQAVGFYTNVLDFRLKYPEETADDGVVNLISEFGELQLTAYENDRLFGSVVNVWVDDVDSRFTKYRSRGLDISGKKESPVHQGPTDQTWGTREFYVTDIDGNTLRFCQPLNS